MVRTFRGQITDQIADGDGRINYIDFAVESCKDPDQCNDDTGKDAQQRSFGGNLIPEQTGEVMSI